MIEPISAQTQVQAQAPVAATASPAKAAETKAVEAQQAAKPANTDVFSRKGTEKSAGTYPKPGSPEMLKQLRADSDRRISSFNAMLGRLIGKQIDRVSKADFANIKVSAAEQKAAQSAIADGGEWSADAVSGRIVDMAKALSGGDPDKIGMLKDAVIKGFKAAEKQWGSALPDITKKTYDNVMKGFDDWEKEARGESKPAEPTE